jgi:hypothetical protein
MGSDGVSETLVRKGRWKVKKSALLMDIMSATGWLMVIPFAFYTVNQDHFPVDSNTFFLVFFILWIRRIISAITHPDKEFEEEPLVLPMSEDQC